MGTCYGGRYKAEIKEERERLRGEGDKIKFLNFPFDL